MRFEFLNFIVKYERHASKRFPVKREPLFKRRRKSNSETFVCKISTGLTGRIDCFLIRSGVALIFGNNYFVSLLKPLFFTIARFYLHLGGVKENFERVFFLYINSQLMRPELQ